MSKIIDTERERLATTLKNIKFNLKELYKPGNQIQSKNLEYYRELKKYGNDDHTNNDNSNQNFNVDDSKLHEIYLSSGNHVIYSTLSLENKEKLRSVLTDFLNKLQKLLLDFYKKKKLVIRIFI